MIRVWIIMTHKGGRYPVAMANGRPLCYVDYNVAAQAMEAICEHDEAYVAQQGGLYLQSITTTRAVLEALRVDLNSQD